MDLKMDLLRYSAFAESVKEYNTAETELRAAGIATGRPGRLEEQRWYQAHCAILREFAAFLGGTESADIVARDVIAQVTASVLPYTPDRLIAMAAGSVLAHDEEAAHAENIARDWSARVVDEARGWLADNGFRPETLESAPARLVRGCIDQLYAGGWPAFVTDAILSPAGADDADDDEGCLGHESLAGAHMGESQYCDGSCA